MPGVVDLWEAGLGRPSVERGLLLASVAEDAPLGERNAALLDLRRRLFGVWIETLARCPACGEASEILFSLDDLFGDSSESGSFEYEGVTVQWRLPNSLDLAYAMRFSDEAEAARAIARRCVVSLSEPLSPLGERGRDEGLVLTAVETSGSTPTLPSPSGEGEASGSLTPNPSPPEGRGKPGDISDAFLEALGGHMDAHDPLAAPTFSVACPECGEPSEFLLDLVEFVGLEIATAARRALADVHELARAYGWTEGEVLALSPVRRRMYLEMVRA